MHVNENTLTKVINALESAFKPFNNITRKKTDESYTLTVQLLERGDSITFYLPYHLNLVSSSIRRKRYWVDGIRILPNIPTYQPDAISIRACWDELKGGLHEEKLQQTLHHWVNKIQRLKALYQELELN